MLLNLFLKYSFVCSSDLIMLEQEIILEQEKQKTLLIQKSLVTLKAGEFYWLS